MKKAKSSKLNTKPKGKPADDGKAGKKDVDAYLAKVPEPARSTLQEVREMIRLAAAKHCSFFPMSLAVIAAHKDELKDNLTSKGTLQFRMDKPLPAALVKKMVKARVEEKDKKKIAGLVPKRRAPKSL